MKWLILGGGQGKYKVGLEHGLVPENKKVLKQQRQQIETKQNGRSTSKENRSQPEKSPKVKAGKIWAKK